MGTTNFRPRESARAGSKYRENRRGKRMNSRAPVRLEWDGPGDQRVRHEAYTRVVNHCGCMVVLPCTLELEHRLVLTNAATGAYGIAVIVWKGNPRPEGWEYGIELVSPEMDFWGLEL